jgi:dCMP deaminase
MFVEILEAVKKRSTCARSQVSALIVKENRIISMGYGGSPSGLPHCLDVGCLIGSNGGCIRTIHAESNAIAFAARHGIAVEGADIWVSLSPCLDCAKLIINSGIVSVYYLEQYRNRDGVELLIAAGIKVFHYAKGRIDRVT